MPPIEFGRKRLFFFIAAIGSLYLIYELFLLTGHEGQDNVSHVPVPDRPYPPPTTAGSPSFLETSYPTWEQLEGADPDEPTKPTVSYVPDAHPVTALMREADAKWRIYEGSRSRTFKQVVEKYRSKHGRHPPPGFKEWYKFARKKNVWNIDDFEQIMDDLRPFWAVQPKIIRTHAAHMWENPDDGVASLHIRDSKIVEVHNPSWRSDTMKQCIDQFIEHVPDMDIPMNRLDQPRVLVPWEDLQKLLATEYETRVMAPEVSYNFTERQEALLDISIKDPEADKSERYNAEWFNAAGKQYMEIASKACPPDSPARRASNQTADLLYKEPVGGLVSNFNLSSDLCTIGPTIQNMHGFLYSSSSVLASHKLVPMFGECKVNVNNDILFPANMYYSHDDRYDYSAKEDLPWAEKVDNIIWRGVTSGGVQVEGNWQTMHRQRLVQLLNGTYMTREARTTDILTEDMASIERQVQNASFVKYSKFAPGKFAEEHTDVGFVQAWGCFPSECPFYNDVFSFKEQTTLTSQFRSKYLIDVDGHSFSGRWHAFLQSKSLGFKATIFREWHDSRLFAWRHFVPVDNRYDDLYSLLTYFIGYGQKEQQAPEAGNQGPYIAAHQIEAQKLARQGREYANKVLRREDIEVYMFRLLLEYGRIIDDNRDRIGYSGDGSELDKFDDGTEETWVNTLGLDRVKQLWDGWGKKPEVGYTNDEVGDGHGDRLGFGKGGPIGDGGK